MKKMFRRLGVLTLFIVCISLFTGCATALKGRSRTLTVGSDVIGTDIQVTTRSGVQHARIGNDQCNFTVDTRNDRGRIHIQATTPDGRIDSRTIGWNSENGRWHLYGGTAITSVFTGAGGLISFVTDIYTGAHKDLDDRAYVYFRFNQQQFVDTSPKYQYRLPPTPPDDPCPPLQKQGQTKRFVYGP